MTPPLPTEPQETEEETPKPPYEYSRVTDERVKKAQDRISDLCHKRREWLPLRVPADREWDNDLLFGSIIRDLKYERDLAEDRLKPVTESEIREMFEKSTSRSLKRWGKEYGEKWVGTYCSDSTEQAWQSFLSAARLFGKVAQ